jgi:hypothetical protein
MPHLRYVDLDSHGYSIVQLDREELRFEWWTVDGLETRSPGTALSASMAVRHGEPRLIGEGIPAGGAAKPPRPPAKAASTKPRATGAKAGRTPAAKKPAPKKPAARPVPERESPVARPVAKPGQPRKPAVRKRPGS